MKLIIEKRSEFNSQKKDFIYEYWILSVDHNGTRSFLCSSDSLEDAEYMFSDLLGKLKPTERTIIKEVEI